MNLPKNRRPTQPGEILKFEFLEPLNMTQQQLADAIGISRVRVNEIILGKRSLSLDTAFRLAKYFNTSPEFRINLQKNVDLWDTYKVHQNDYNQIKPLDKMVA